MSDVAQPQQKHQSRCKSLFPVLSMHDFHPDKKMVRDALGWTRSISQGGDSDYREGVPGRASQLG